MGGGRISLLDDLGQITQLATRISQPQVPVCNSSEVSPESEVPQHLDDCGKDHCSGAEQLHWILVGQEALGPEG